MTVILVCRSHRSHRRGAGIPVCQSRVRNCGTADRDVCPTLRSRFHAENAAKTGLDRARAFPYSPASLWRTERVVRRRSRLRQRPRASFGFTTRRPLRPPTPGARVCTGNALRRVSADRTKLYSARRPVRGVARHSAGGTTRADAAVRKTRRSIRPIAPGKVRSPLPPWDPLFPGAFFARVRKGRCDALTA